MKRVGFEQESSLSKAAAYSLDNNKDQLQVYSILVVTQFIPHFEFQVWD